MPATVQTAGTLTLTFDSETYSCQIISAAWAFVGEEIYTGCSPTDGAAEAGRAGDGATWELTLEVLHDWSTTGLSFVLLTGTPGEVVTYDLTLDADTAAQARKYVGDAVVPRVAEEWSAGNPERGQIVIPVRTRVASRYTAP